MTSHHGLANLVTDSLLPLFILWIGEVLCPPMERVGQE